MDNNPYSAPTSSVDTPTDPGKFQLHDPRTVSISHGVQWISDGFSHLGKDPVIWVFITVTYFAISYIPTAVVYINEILGILVSFGLFFLSFVWLGGLMLGCRAQDSGAGLNFSHLFAGFTVRVGSLILLSVVLFVLMFVAIVIVAIAMAGQFASFANIDPEQITPAMLMSNLTTILLPLLIILLFAIPITMIVWFAPALMVLNNTPFFEAMGLSFKGCLKNMLPFLIYGLVLLVVGIIAAVIVGIATAIVGSWSYAVYLAFMLFAFPIINGSIYQSYKDIYIST